MRYVSQIKIIFILFISSISFAGTPTVTTFQTRITTPSGAALEAASVNFRFTILDSAGTCALYVEDYANVNMSGSSGIVSFSLGAGAKQYPAGLVSMYEVFNNSAPSFPCQAGGTYVPGPTDRRQIVMQFNDGSGWQTLPQLAINSVFYSNYAIRSENLGSYPANDYLRPVTLPTCTASQSLRWDGTTFTCITAGGGGSMTGVTSISNVSGDISLAAASGTGSVLVSSNTQSTSTTTGALVVTGGVGVSGAINTAGNITSGGAISAGSTVSANTSMYTPQLYGTSTPSGSIKIDGTSNATHGHVLLVPSGGNVGIGTTTPTAILDVFGGTSLTGNGRGINLMAENAYSSGPVDYVGGKITIKAGRGYVYGGAGDVSIAAGDSSSGGTGATLVLGGAPYQTAGTATLTGGGGWNGMGNVTIQGGASTPVGYVLLQPAGGKVGIGTSTPAYPLHVVGVAGIGDGTIRMGGSGWGEAGAVNIGINNSVGYSNSIAVGNTNNTGAGDSSTALGYHNSAAADASTAVGFYNTSGQHGTAVGYMNSASQLNGVAIGVSNTLSAANTIAIGNGITNAVASSLMIGPSNTAKMTILSSGDVGVGTSTPAEKLHVVGNIAATGQIASGSQTITGGTTSIDWNNGNAIMTDYDCGSPLQFANLRDGGSYTLVVTSTGTAQCNFSTTTTGTGAATVSYRFKPANGVRTSSSYTVYTLLRVGTTVLVSWTSGF
jgi:trimeric autotransporter adhesin